MAHRQRWYVTQVVFEVTIRTLGGKFWLRPDAACKAIIEGVFGKALQHYDGIQLHAYDAESNHVHYLASATDPAQIPLFLDFVHGNIARQINALRRRRGTFWSRRGAVIAVLDPKAQVARLRYLLAQGPAPGLVCSPTQWPGASSTRAARRFARAGHVRLARQAAPQRRAVRSAPGRRARRGRLLRPDAAAGVGGPDAGRSPRQGRRADRRHREPAQGQELPGRPRDPDPEPAPRAEEVQALADAALPRQHGRRLPPLHRRVPRLPHHLPARRRSSAPRSRRLADRDPAPLPARQPGPSRLVHPDTRELPAALARRRFRRRQIRRRHLTAAACSPRADAPRPPAFAHHRLFVRDLTPRRSGRRSFRSDVARIPRRDPSCVHPCRVS
ncbi:MAG: transposase [Myxococcales bacterium]|nr:transposase [Myxococcales bacterium]